MKTLVGFFAAASLFASFAFADAHSHTTAPVEEAPAEETLVKIKVILSDFSFGVEGLPAKAPIVLKAGQKYKISFENHGSVLHEVLLGRGLVKIGAEQEYKENLLPDVPVTITGSSVIEGTKRVYAVVTNGFVEFEIDPALRISLLFTVPESAKGTWELGCFATGHHEAGMFLPVVVE